MGLPPEGSCEVAGKFGGKDEVRFELWRSVVLVLRLYAAGFPVESSL